MNSIGELRSEIIRLEQLLSEKNEELKKMNSEIAALVTFIVRHKISYVNVNKNVVISPSSTPDGQDVIPKSRF
jgi:predicted  nucleic acid-binding Zn-ribbon protein